MTTANQQLLNLMEPASSIALAIPRPSKLLLCVANPTCRSQMPKLHKHTCHFAALLVCYAGCGDRGEQSGTSAKDPRTSRKPNDEPSVGMVRLFPEFGEAALLHESKRPTRGLDASASVAWISSSASFKRFSSTALGVLPGGNTINCRTPPRLKPARRTVTLSGNSWFPCISKSEDLFAPVGAVAQRPSGAIDVGANKQPRKDSSSGWVDRPIRPHTPQQPKLIDRKRQSHGSSVEPLRQTWSADTAVLRGDNSKHNNLSSPTGSGEELKRINSLSPALSGDNRKRNNSLSPVQNGDKFKRTDSLPVHAGKKLSAHPERLSGHVSDSNHSFLRPTDTNFTNVVTDASMLISDKFTSNRSLSTWVEDASIGSPQKWYDIAMSRNGTHRTAVVQPGNIWRSIDSGATWTEDTTVGAPQLWRAVAMSADGMQRTAVALNGLIWNSENAGLTWHHTSNLKGKWVSVSMSSDGTKRAVAQFADSIWVSHDSGATWQRRGSPKGQYWRAVVISDDGLKLGAAVNGGGIWSSDDAGATWTEFVPPVKREDMGDGDVISYPRWISIAMSGDGKYRTAVAVLDFIWTSDDYGKTWSRNEKVGERQWWSVAMSADGAQQITCVRDGNIFFSVDAGATWIEEDPLGAEFTWHAIAISGDGQQRAAAVMGGNIWSRMFLSEEQAFSQIASSGVAEDMAAFIVSMVEGRGGVVISDGTLQGFLPYYTGNKAIQSYAHLMTDLANASWILSKDKADDEKERFLQVVDANSSTFVELFTRSAIAARGGKITKEGDFTGFTKFYSSRRGHGSYEDFARELTSLPWIEY